MNKKYLISVSVMTFVIPVLGFIIERPVYDTPGSFSLFGKWFIFSAVGLRLVIVGIQQATKPAFTAKEIFHVDSTEIFPVVRELGFANLCFGLVGIISLFKPEWRIVSAFASGLYYGIAGLQHAVRKPAGINEKFALWTDLLIFAVLLVYLIMAG
ncbi:hypothetical protein GS399_04980 [Pedobacter sp. HMF7647]|uniref:DoxX family protein n=1 Tax=Hufsiella arboris TaxID=2695275 RepID=A0A7K1Y6X1_9SPHI|nr:DUF6790 family protein [Hufsiella arboris]MXV50317.1 hypothetical protein [Hufsiella arboris]